MHGIIMKTKKKKFALSTGTLLAAEIKAHFHLVGQLVGKLSRVARGEEK